jgi:hypothetical protein
MLAAFDGWSIAELLRNERFAQAPDESLPPTSAMNARAEPATARQPDWLANAQWHSASDIAPWPEPPSTPRPRLSEDPRYRDVNRIRRRTPSRYSPMGPPYLNEPPHDYPSHLGPVPQAPDWEQVVPTGATPWSPLRPRARATDWGQVLTGIECRRTEDGNHRNCTTPGGRQFTVPGEGLPDYIGPGQPNYHYYNVPVGGPRVDPSLLEQGVIDKPTPGPRLLVRPATPEGTLNEATPSLGYSAFLGGTQLPYGTPQNPVRSYLTRDQTGALMVVNVTMSGHGLQPGIVVRYVTDSPRGTTIQNEGSGLGFLQAPDGWPAAHGISDWINNVWGPQSRAIIEEQLRRQRR